jgi:hypothetical protein
MEQREADALAAQLIAFLETGKAAPGLFAEDVFLDFTLPRWRLQAEGLRDVIQLRLNGHPGVGRVARSRCDATGSGFVLEVEEEWHDKGEAWYCRELLRADVRAQSISALSVYCTGDWDTKRRTEHAREVHLSRR